MYYVGLDVPKEFCQANVLDESGEEISSTYSQGEFRDRSPSHSSTLPTGARYTANSSRPSMRNRRSIPCWS